VQLREIHFYLFVQVHDYEGSTFMSGKLFIEQREEGDFAIRRPDAERISGHEPTQAGAIERAREIDPNAAILVERVRNTDRGHRDKWRKP
jgi:hypothetical protein